MEKVSFTTEDGVKIVGDFYPADSQRAVLLLHMMPATKESWAGFAKKLVGAGWNALAIDLRGHGKSVLMLANMGTEGVNVSGKRDEQAWERLDYEDFTDAEHQGSFRDIEAARDWLKEQGFTMEAIVGASIGANLALWYQSVYTEILKTVLLSPGFNYRGIESRLLVQKLEDPQGLYLVGGSKDERSDGSTCGQVAQELYKLAPVQNKELEVLETDKHGTDLFQTDPALMDRIIDWASRSRS